MLSAPEGEEWILHSAYEFKEVKVTTLSQIRPPRIGTIVGSACAPELCEREKNSMRANTHVTAFLPSFARTCRAIWGANLCALLIGILDSSATLPAKPRLTKPRFRLTHRCIGRFIDEVYEY